MTPGSSSRRTRCTALTLTLLAAATPSLAADGLIEINQARAMAGGITAGDAPGFPVTLGASGSYRLTGNLTVSGANISALVVSAPHVSIDLNGFSISGPAVCTVSPQTGATTGCTPAGSGAGVSGFVEDVSVTGGSIQGMAGNGIELGDEARVERMKITRNGSSGIAISRGVIVRNSVVRNGGNGIEGGGVVSENEVTGNKGIGIVSNGVVLGNAVLGNQSGGASLNSHAGFADNQFFLNGGSSVDGGISTGGNVCDDGRCRDAKGRRFYLSRNGATGVQALTACAAGFHLASLFEILDPSHLEYDTTLGLGRPDSGKGPPTGLSGWIRTGFDSGGEFFNAVQGQQNCGSWAGGTGGQFASLAADWSPAASGSRFAAWNVGIAFCNAARSVWCVQD